MAEITKVYGNVRIESDGSGRGTRVTICSEGQWIDISHLIMSVKWEMSKETHKRGLVSLTLLPAEAEIHGKLLEIVEWKRPEFIEAEYTEFETPE